MDLVWNFYNFINSVCIAWRDRNMLLYYKRFSQQWRRILMPNCYVFLHIYICLQYLDVHLFKYLCKANIICVYNVKVLWQSPFGSVIHFSFCLSVWCISGLSFVLFCFVLFSLSFRANSHGLPSHCQIARWKGKSRRLSDKERDDDQWGIFPFSESLWGEAQFMLTNSDTPFQFICFPSWPIWGVPCRSPEVKWDWFQLPHNPDG